MRPSKLTGYLMILASALLFGSYGVWSRLLGRDFGIFTQGWVRSLIILVILLPILLAKRQLRWVAPVNRPWFWGFIVFTVFTQFPIYYAFNHMAIGTATLIFYAFFLITQYIVGWRVFSEKITLIKLISMVLALAGLTLTFGFSLAVFSVVAMLMAAANGVASGGEVSLSKQITTHNSTLLVTFYAWLATLVTHLPAAMLAGERLPSFSLQSVWWAMAGYALAGLLGFWLVVEGFRHVDASLGGLIGLTEIIFSIGFGLALFGDPLTPTVLVGAALILLAAMLPDVWALRYRGQQPASVLERL